MQDKNKDTKKDYQEGKGKANENRGGSSEGSGAFKEFFETTSNVVQKAASILEEEIAAGVLAAKQVEKHFVDIDEVRLGKSDDVMQRFRKDAHEVVDILIDMATIAMKQINNLTRQVVTIEGFGKPKRSGGMPTGQVPTLRMPQSIKAGESVSLPMTLENNSDEPTEEFNFQSTTLVSASGDVIPAEQLTFTPPSLSIGPHGTAKVLITITVPGSTPSGTYSGLVQATRMNDLRAVLIVQVD